MAKNFRAHGEEVAAVHDISFEVEQGQVVTLLGPSGCGKTTLLRCIAGLETPDNGVLTVDGRTLFSKADRISVPAHDREMAMIFQSYALWPHMTVYKNVAFPLVHGRLKLSRADAKERVEAALELVRLRKHATRPVYALSGGQQQRVALARALARRPKVLLLDEPLSNLDQQLKVQTRREMHTLLKNMNITAINVTHDQGEALAISDRIAVVDQGKLLQFASPQEIFRAPAHVAVAKFLGNMNLIPGTLTALRENDAVVQTGIGEIIVSADRVHSTVTVGTECVVGIPIRHISVSLAGATNRSTVKVKVVRAEYLGSRVELECLSEGTDEIVRVRLDPDDADGALRPPANVELSFDPQKCIVLNRSEPVA